MFERNLICNEICDYCDKLKIEHEVGGKGLNFENSIFIV